MQMRTLHSGSHAFVLILSSFDFINIHCGPFQGHFGNRGLCSIIQPIFSLDIEGQSNSFWESLLSVEAANILLPSSASSEFGPLSFIIKYCKPMS